MSASPETERLYWPADQIALWQRDRLRETVERAARSPFYGPRLAGLRIESVADLAQLPLTTKEHVREASPFGLLAVPREELFQYHETFGTTGTPASSWLTAGDLNNYATQINQAAVDFHPGDRLLVRFPYAISVPAHIFTQAARLRGACVVPCSSRTAISPYPRVIDLLTKLEVTVLGCLPMEAIFLAEAARQLGRESGSDFPHLRAICTAGELLSDARRRRIAELWNVPVYNLYGCTEAGNIAADSETGRLHLSWDHFLLELLDERGRPVAPGERGLAVLTTLTRQAMPLLRYVLGDTLRLHQPPPGAGRQSPVIEHFGRDLNQFEFQGKWWFVRDLEERLLAAPVQAVGNLWLLEVGRDAVRFRVEAAEPQAAVNRRLEQQIGDELGLAITIDPVPIGNLLDRSRLLRVEPVNKPRVVGRATAGAAPLTLDALMAGEG